METLNPFAEEFTGGAILVEDSFSQRDRLTVLFKLISKSIVDSIREGDVEDFAKWYQFL